MSFAVRIVIGLVVGVPAGYVLGFLFRRQAMVETGDWHG